MANKNLETGRLGRLIGLARAGTTTGLGLLRPRSSDLSAEKAALILGQLRGLAAKAGQTLSYVDGVFPEEQREVFEKALGVLQSSTPASSFEDVRAIVEGELNAPLERLFSDFDESPFASASIGQVHRAALADGTSVAVKVQHPGIEAAVESDLKNVGVIPELIATLGPRSLNVREILETVRARFREELDYALEAEHQEFFRKFHANDPLVEVPRVIAERSSRRVLTSQFLEGEDLDWGATQPPDLRRSIAKTLWRFVFRSNLVAGCFNADPHPGNFLFRGDGSVVFLDFGCVQPLSVSMRQKARRAHLAALNRDEDDFRAAISAMMGLRGGRYGEAALAYVRRCFEPLFCSPFQLTRPWVSSLVRGTQELKKEMLARDGSLVPMPAELALLNRLQFGFYSVLARLDVPVDYAEVERSFLGEDV